MIEKITKIYLRGCFYILFLTGFAKIVSSFGVEPILSRPDPILLMQNRFFFFLLGILELGICLVVLTKSAQQTKLFIISLFGSFLTVYRIGIWWIGWEGDCPCLGNISSLIDISPKYWNFIMQTAWIYILLALPLWFYNKRRINLATRV